MTQGAVDKSSAKKADSTSTQYVYFFGGGKADQRRIAGASGIHNSNRVLS